MKNNCQHLLWPCTLAAKGSMINKTHFCHPEFHSVAEAAGRQDKSSKQYVANSDSPGVEVFSCEEHF